VLLVACWEAYIEDLASLAFEILLENAQTPDVFPNKVLVKASKPLRESQDETEVWKLAGQGWRETLRTQEKKILAKYVDNLNTPKPEQIDFLFETLIGLRTLSRHWSWRGMSSDRAKAKLLQLVELRGQIAHRVTSSESVHKADVNSYLEHIQYLAAVSSNVVLRHLMNRTGVQVVKTAAGEWAPFQYGKVG
jgi:hypothetical protein